MGANLDSLLQKIAAGATPWKQAVRVVAAGNITLSALQTIDGVTVAEGDRVLCAGQTAPAECGIYTASAGAWSRAIDMDRDSYAKLGTAVHVMAGTSNAGEVYILTAPATGTVRVGVTSQTWTKYAPAAGSPFPLDDGMGNTIDVTAGTTSAITASDGLQLASGSTLDIDIDSANDIFLDVGANADVIHVAAAGTDKLTITPGAAGVTLNSASGVTLGLGSIAAPVEVSAGTSASVTALSGTVSLLDDSNGSSLVVDASITLSPAGVDAVLSQSAGALTLAPQDAALTIQPTAAAAGVGKAVTVKAGSGASGSAGGVASLIGGDGVGTNQAGGNVDLHVGTRTGSGTEGQVVLKDGGGTGRLFMFYETATTSVFLRNASIGGIGVQIGSTSVAVGGDNLTTTLGGLASGATVVNGTNLNRNVNYVQFNEDLPQSAALAASGLATIATFVVPSDLIVCLVAQVTWTNDTDNTGGSAVVRITARNVAGTVTVIGAAFVDPDLFESDDTGITAETQFTADNSGATLRVRCNPGDADSRNFNTLPIIYRRVRV